MIFDPILGKLTSGRGNNAQTDTSQKIITNSTSSVAHCDLAANTRYVYTKPLTYLAVFSVENSNLESEIQFTTGSSITVTLPEGLQYVGSVAFYPYTNYIINIKNNIAVVASYE